MIIIQTIQGQQTLLRGERKGKVFSLIFFYLFSGIAIHNPLDDLSAADYATSDKPPAWIIINYKNGILIKCNDNTKKVSNIWLPEDSTEFKDAMRKISKGLLPLDLKNLVEQDTDEISDSTFDVGVEHKSDEIYKPPFEAFKGNAKTIGGDSLKISEVKDIKIEIDEKCEHSELTTLRFRFGNGQTKTQVSNQYYVSITP